MKQSIPLYKRMWNYISIRGDCWEWAGYTQPNGYARTKVNGKPELAHRAVYELLVGAIPADKHLDHLCMNKKCVNPTHLEPVSPKENSNRWALSIHECPSGHPRDENIRISPKGQRYCHSCRINYQRKYRLRLA